MGTRRGGWPLFGALFSQHQGEGLTCTKARASFPWAPAFTPAPPDLAGSLAWPSPLCLPLRENLPRAGTGTAGQDTEPTAT